MKEATGELNMTVITVVAIAAVAALFYTLVWPKVKTNIENSTKCANAVCDDCDGSTCTCLFINDNGDAENILCNAKGINKDEAE